jgi:hypothetical protein
MRSDQLHSFTNDVKRMSPNVWKDKQRNRSTDLVDVDIDEEEEDIYPNTG